MVLREKGVPGISVLDGQQRLSAMYYAFVAPEVSYPRRAKQALFFINVEKLNEEEYDDAFYYKWRTQQLSRLLTDRAVSVCRASIPAIGIWGRGVGPPKLASGICKILAGPRKRIN